MAKKVTDGGCHVSRRDLTRALHYNLLSELRSMGTRPTNVGRLSTGAVKLCWIWHGKISLESLFNKSSNKSSARSCLIFVRGGAAHFVLRNIVV